MQLLLLSSNQYTHLIIICLPFWCGLCLCGLKKRTLWLCRIAQSSHMRCLRNIPGGLNLARFAHCVMRMSAPCHHLVMMRMMSAPWHCPAPPWGQRRGGVRPAPPASRPPASWPGPWRSPCCLRLAPYSPGRELFKLDEQQMKTANKKSSSSCSPKRPWKYIVWAMINLWKICKVSWPSKDTKAAKSTKCCRKAGH